MTAATRCAIYRRKLVSLHEVTWMNPDTEGKGQTNEHQVYLLHTSSPTYSFNILDDVTLFFVAHAPLWAHSVLPTSLLRELSTRWQHAMIRMAGYHDRIFFLLFVLLHFPRKAG